MLIEEIGARRSIPIPDSGSIAPEGGHSRWSESWQQTGGAVETTRDTITNGLYGYVSQLDTMLDCVGPGGGPRGGDGG
jgi:hypothetical protein